MNPKVAIATYDVHGVVLQISHTLIPELSREDVIGTTVHDWGDANQHLSGVMFSQGHCHVSDITWSGGITRVTSMKLEPASAVVVAAHRVRTWVLTETETSVILAIADGMNISEAAAHLLLSNDAIKSALVRVRSKTGARGTAHAVAICCRAGVI